MSAPCVETSVVPRPDPAPTPAPFALHGGALGAARRLYPDAPEPWIDLSTGINPQAYPVGIIPEDAWGPLPEAAAVTALEAAAARRYGCGAGSAIVAAPGTQALIQRLPQVLGGRDVRIVGPTYGEYAKVFGAAGASVRAVTDLADLAGGDVAVVVNPNNPDGRRSDPAALGRLASQVGALVVDEAFMDAIAPGPSFVARLPVARTVVLRSFGKFYGLAGLRLGFAIAASDRVAHLRDALGPWAVSGPALVVGARALDDTAWADATRARLAGDAARLDALLVEAGLAVLGGTPLFRLAGHARAGALFEALAQAGILTRPFEPEPSWLRFGLPGGPEAWSRLAATLAAFRG